MQSSPRIDPDALDRLCAHWLQKIPTSNTAYPEEDRASLKAATLADIKPGDDVALGALTSFELGFNIGVKVAAAIIGDPLGNPTELLTEALEHAEAEVRDIRRDHKRFDVTPAAAAP